MTPQEKTFEIGPDMTGGAGESGDLRQERPYFVILLEKEKPGAENEPIKPGDDLFEKQQKRVADWVNGAVDEAQRLLLRPDDLLNPAGFAARLKQARPAVGPAATPADPAAAHLRDALSCDTLRLIDNLPGAPGVPGPPGATPPPPLRAALHVALVNELNALLGDACLYSINRLPGPGVTLADAVKKMLDDPEQGRLVRRELKPIFGDGAVPITGGDVETLLKTPASVEAITGRALVFLNRLLLQIAFPKDFAPVAPRNGVSDIYVLSHGWHRNFFDGIAAYDQLVSRFAILMQRRRLANEPPYHPLFLGVHWHSDPGEDAWVDGKGRRNKASFLQNVETVFERPSAEAERHVSPGERFTDAFEDVYELFSRLSAPDTDALSDEKLKEEAHVLGGRLKRFTLRDAAGAEDADKIATAWTCYFRAQPKGLLVDQTEEPARSLSPEKAHQNLASFLRGVFGAGLILALLRIPPLAWIGAGIGSLWNSLVTYLANGINGYLPRLPPRLTRGVVHVALDLIAFLLIAALSWWFLKRKANVREDKKPRRLVPFTQVLAWAPVQIVTAFPWLFYLFRTYLFGNLSRRQRGAVSPRDLFDEREGRRGQDVAPTGEGAESDPRPPWRQRRRLAENARKAVTLFRDGLYKGNDPSGNKGNALINTADNQMAFWQMQETGTRAGRTTAQFLAALLEGGAAGHLSGARVHLIAHSFGGLVVTNAVRHLVHEKDPDNGKGAADVWAAHPRLTRNGTPVRDAQGNVVPRIASVCLLEAAIASNWFENEFDIVGRNEDGTPPAQDDETTPAERRGKVAGTVACIYSAYDTANGFFYPVANRGRLAAGHVGLFPATIPHHKRDANRRFLMLPVPAQTGLLASLVESPDLPKPSQACGRPVTRAQTRSTPREKPRTTLRRRVKRRAIRR